MRDGWLLRWTMKQLSGQEAAGPSDDGDGQDYYGDGHDRVNGNMACPNL